MEEQERLKRKTPSQAEGSEETVEAQLGHDGDEEQDPAVRTPSQAEGSEETVDQALREQERES